MFQQRRIISYVFFGTMCVLAFSAVKVEKEDVKSSGIFLKLNNFFCCHGKSGFYFRGLILYFEILTINLFLFLYYLKGKREKEKEWIKYRGMFRVYTLQFIKYTMFLDKIIASQNTPMMLMVFDGRKRMHLLKSL